MGYPKIWGGIASHSSDTYFDFVYRSDWPAVLTLQRYAPASKAKRPVLQQSNPGDDDGRVAAFLQDVWSRPPGGDKKITGSEMMALMLLGMAASYDPNLQAANGFHLPFDLQSGALPPKRWRNWLRHDPINLVSRHRRKLQTCEPCTLTAAARISFTSTTAIANCPKPCTMQRSIIGIQSLQAPILALIIDWTLACRF